MKRIGKNTLKKRITILMNEYFSYIFENMWRNIMVQIEFHLSIFVNLNNYDHCLEFGSFETAELLCYDSPNEEAVLFTFLEN